MNSLIRLSRKRIQELTHSRSGEVKMGNYLAEVADSVTEKKLQLVCVSEDIGVRANLGRPGAALAPDELIASLLNMQYNGHAWQEDFEIAGWVDVHELQQQSQSAGLDELRHLTREVDERVVNALTPIYKSGGTPIIIGGGHNNAYPAIKTLYKHSERPVGVINIDAHTDLRAMEGRHSGNGFSYALDEGLLAYYSVIGLSPNFTPTTILEQIENDDRLSAQLYRSHQAYELPTEGDIPYGLEIDMDVVADFPSSAQNPCGMSLQELFQLVESVITIHKPSYVHICEASPAHELYAGQVGKALSGLVAHVARCLFP